MWYRSLFWVMLVLLLSGREVDAADLAEAKQRLLEWEQKIFSLRVRSQSRSEAKTNTGIAEAGLKFAGTDYDWTWEDTGRLRDQSTGWNDSGITSRSLRMRDYDYSYQFVFQANDKELKSPTSLTVRENSILPTTQNHIQPSFRGLWNDAERTWIGERIKAVQDATLTKDGLLEIDGTPLGLKGQVVRLDPEHGYLPRSIESKGGYLYQVDEFQEVEPGFWFPKTGTFQSTSSDYQVLRKWEIKKVELNIVFPDSLFKPPLSDKTQIFYDFVDEKKWLEHNRPVKIQENAGPLKTPFQPLAIWPLWLFLVGILIILLLSIWKRQRRAS